MADGHGTGCSTAECSAVKLELSVLTMEQMEQQLLSADFHWARYGDRLKSVFGEQALISHDTPVWRYEVYQRPFKRQQTPIVQ